MVGVGGAGGRIKQADCRNGLALGLEPRGEPAAQSPQEENQQPREREAAAHRRTSSPTITTSV